MKTQCKPTNALKRHGFKQVSPANLLAQDDHPSYPSRLNGNKWIKVCLKPQLNPSVPEEVAFLFEVARGSMVYAQFFLPLASLATEEGFRVLEAGVRHRCKQLGLADHKSGKLASLSELSYSESVTALHNAGVIPTKDLEAWQSMRFLRNTSSHRTSAVIRARHDAISQLSFIAELLNRLFR